jgi:hypothetical protein
MLSSIFFLQEKVSLLQTDITTACLSSSPLRGIYRKHRFPIGRCRTTTSDRIRISPNCVGHCCKTSAFKLNSGFYIEISFKIHFHILK